MSETSEGAQAETRRAETAQRPLLRVVRGNPSPTDVAALTAVLMARAKAAEAAREAGVRQPVRVSRWNDRSRQLRGPLPRGADAWRAALR